MNYNNIELITPPEPPQSFYAGDMEFNKKLYACLMSMYCVLSSLIPSFDSILSSYSGMSGKLFVQEAQLDELTKRVDALTNTTSAEVLAEEIGATYEPGSEVTENEDKPLSSADADTFPEGDSIEGEADADALTYVDSSEPEVEEAGFENVDEV